ncbi:unnamed protein product, partial [Rotaria sp. Silwood1]
LEEEDEEEAGISYESIPGISHKDALMHLSMVRKYLEENFTEYNLYYDIEDMIEKNALINRTQICQKVIQQRYGFSTSTLSSNRSITSQQQSPISNQLRVLTNSHSVPQSSHITGNINLTKTTPASIFSSYHHDQQSSIVSPPTQNLAIAQLAQCVNNQTLNGVLKDRNNQQQQQQHQQIDKRTRSFKEQFGTKLSTLNETHSLPVYDTQSKIDTNDQLTPTQKRKETKRKSNLFT